MLRQTVGRRSVGMMLAMMVVGAMAAGRVDAAIVFSNYGPNGEYNNDRTTADGGALWAYNGIWPYGAARRAAQPSRCPSISW